MPAIFLSIAILSALPIFAQTKKNPAMKEYQVLKTEACGHQKAEAGNLKIPALFAWTVLLKNDTDNLIVDPKTACLQVGQKLQLIREDTNQPLAEVTPQLIKIFTAGDRASQHLHLQHMLADFHMRMNDKEQEADRPYAVVQLKIDSLSVTDPGFFSRIPYVLPDYAQAINGPRFRALQKAKPFVAVIDSDTYLQTRTQLPDAATVPVAKKYEAVILDSIRSATISSAAAFPVGTLPKKKYSPIVVIGEDALDILPFKFIYLLGELDYKNLFLVKGGLEGLNHEIPLTPQKVPGIKVIDAEEVQRQILLASTIVDVRPESSIRFDFRIPGAKSIAYNEAEESPKSTNLSISSLSEDTFDKSDLPLNKSSSLVFLGRDVYDWRPYKAAFIARQEGHLNVNVFRGGAAEWYFHHLKNPQRFRTAERTAPSVSPVEEKPVIRRSLSERTVPDEIAAPSAGSELDKYNIPEPPPAEAEGGPQTKAAHPPAENPQ